ncbi:unnamed protein product [Nesidiocoris tenuis]|uniref:Uncharacterized protein n=1 Tax=Nesidiocoris tenuis TaxID=355587 RepID=A0A6H5HFQ0_9HEMI|nr:unnamed protein product [Nesidiocoris tenuis]
MNHPDTLPHGSHHGLQRSAYSAKNYKRNLPCCSSTFNILQVRCEPRSSMCTRASIVENFFSVGANNCTAGNSEYVSQTLDLIDGMLRFFRKRRKVRHPCYFKFCLIPPSAHEPPLLPCLDNLIQEHLSVTRAPALLPFQLGSEKPHVAQCIRYRPNPNWKPNPTPNPQKSQTNQFSRQPQNQGPSSFQNHPKPSFSVQKPIQPPRPASTQAVPMSWRTSNPNFHNMETGQETGNELENPGDNETENQIEYDQNYASDQEHFLDDTGLPQEFPDSN